MQHSTSYIKKVVLLFTIFFSQFSFSQNFNKVNDWLDDNINDLGGRAVILIYKDGKIIYEQTKNEISRKQKFGAKWLERKTGKDINLDDFTVDTKQRIASCSKWLTAALAMTFIDEGKLNLEDTIGKFLPVMTAHSKGKIKVWQCLSHLTGIKQVGVAAAMNGSNDDTGEEAPRKTSLKDKLEKLATKKDNGWSSMQQAIDSIAGAPMEGEPGKTFHYGNAGLQIIAAILEKIGNKDFETLFQERIAKPLQMNNTDFGKVAVPLAAGGAWSTPKEYLNFIQMILNEGRFSGKQIISKNSIIEMQKNRVAKDAKIMYSPAEAGVWGYGFGEWIMDGSTELQRSTAVTSPGLFGTFPWVDHQKKYCAILFTFNIKSKGRHERYTALKKEVDDAITKQLRQ
jgi:CubicO group peptidase (beta-lactamase class C family)